MELLDDKVLSVEEFFAAISQYLTPRQVQFVREAYNFAAEVHANQKEFPGIPILFTLGCGRNFSSVENGRNYLAAAFLHDVVEDTNVSLQDLRGYFLAKKWPAW